MAAFIGLLGLFTPALRGAETVRQVIAHAIVEEDDAKKVAIINSLAGRSDDAISVLFSSWKEDAIFIQKEGDTKIPVLLTGDKDAADAQAAFRVDDGLPLKGADGQPMRLAAADLDTAGHDLNLRSAMKGVLDLIALSSPDWMKRVRAINMIGMSQEVEKLPPLFALQKTERDGKAQHALREAIALIQLKDGNSAVQITACRELGELGSISSQDFLTQLVTDSSDKPEVVGAAKKALSVIASHVRTANAIGTAFRGLSTGSVLLVVAIGLAITFGLMGVINMAHGELIVVGAYTTYIVQNVFGTGLAISPFGKSVWIPGFNIGGPAYELYFLVSLPLAFLAAAVVGIGLERGIIRFLYRRPLESLLATWGVSLVLQQLFRLIFGANNVQVYSPSYLSGNWTFFDVQFAWARVFVIVFAVAIIFGTHLLLTKTSLGLLIRAVMQNRVMAACVGVKTERVNMLTFGFGSGLAGLAGAFLSQIDNIGPGLGQKYIVDAFMTVVVGGVGNLMGTVISALGIGVIDQSLQQILLNPVLGKILVLLGIILFLQWRPAGIFVAKSRSLEG